MFTLKLKDPMWSLIMDTELGLGLVCLASGPSLEIVMYIINVLKGKLEFLQFHFCTD